MALVLVSVVRVPVVVIAVSGIVVIVELLVVVAVRAIRAVGAKGHELAEGLAELRDEYVSFKTATLMFVSVSWLVFQQTFIWFSV